VRQILGWFKAKDTIINSSAKVNFRQSALALQRMMVEAPGGKFQVGDNTWIVKKPFQYALNHYFSPISEKYGCCAYARQIFLPKGDVVVGKIHKHAHLNFIMKGKVSVATEFGKKYFEAPLIFISEPGLKRVVRAEEDTIWATVHLTEHHGEENLDKMEDEIIARTYQELGMIDSVQALSLIGGGK
jgi:hypothetical protein